ncbi:HAT domain-containing protein [Ilyonectria robusta]
MKALCIWMCHIEIRPRQVSYLSGRHPKYGSATSPTESPTTLAYTSVLLIAAVTRIAANEASRRIWAGSSNVSYLLISDRNFGLAIFRYNRKHASVLDEPGNEDEFEKFNNSPPRPMTTSTPLEWWCREEQRIKYPHLHQLAIDILSVPAMSDDPERVFSCTRRTISWDRARLSAGSVEKLQCLSNG